jgi:hypothetical protein
MIQTKNINALCCGESPAVMQPFTSSVTPHIEFLSRLFGSIYLRIGQKISVVSKKVFVQNIDGYPVLAKEDKVQRSRCKTVVDDLKGSESVSMLS